MGGPDRIRATSHMKSLCLANLAPRRSATRWKGSGRTRQGPANEIVFSHHEVGGEIVGSPTIDQGRNRWAELVEKIAQLKAFSRVQRNIGHAARV
jgi:hypothetical protein